MDFLDIRTLLIVSGAMYLLLPVAVWLVLRMPRQQAQILWSAGGMIGGLGLVLMGLRGAIPDTVSYLIGQPLLALGALVTGQSLRIDASRPWPWAWIAGMMAAYVAALGVLLAEGQTQALGVLIRAVNLVAILSIVEAAWHTARAETSRNAMTIAGAYVCQLLGTLANLIGALRGSVDIQTMSASPVAATTALVTLVVSIVASTSYLGLMLERSRRRQALLAEALAEAQRLQERRDALIRLDRERSLGVLSDSLAHDLLQPLTAARLRVEFVLRLLKTEAARSKPDAAWLDPLIGNLHRASATVERIRSFVRLASFEAGRVDLREALRTLGQLLRQAAVSQNVSLQFDTQGEPVWTWGDTLWLSQAILQAVRNAMTALAHQEHRRIEVRLEQDAEQVRIRIADNGPGFPEHVLASFPDGPGHPGRPLGNMGLFVVQSIVQRHHGSVVLENAPRAGGAVVTLTLPRLLEPRPQTTVG